MKHKFDALESRIVNLERSYQNPNPNPAAQVLVWGLLWSIRLYK